MANNKPSVKDWERNPAISRAGTKGFNPNEEIPKMLKAEFDWLKDFDFAMCIASDIPTALYGGWKHLLAEYFDVENFNAAIGLRFGLNDADGVIKLEENYIMIMPTAEAKRVLDERNDAFEEHYEKVTRSSGIYTDKNDPDGRKLQDRMIEKHPDSFGLEEEQFSVGTSKKRGPGRPPKEK